MPNLEPVTLGTGGVSLRHVGPAAAVWPGVSSPVAPSASVLSKTLFARPLPCSDLPASPDLVQGSYTTRLGDSGEFQIAVPNGAASDGVLWRSRFDPTGHLQWVETYVGGELEGVFCLDTVNPSDGQGFSSTLDATDFCASLWGNGAGMQTGTVGQLQSVVYDPATLLAALFDVQGWQDFSDAAFPSLLQALLNSALGLRLTPWQHLSVDGSGGGGSVGVHGQDGMFVLKKAYERDWTVVQAPRDVIERATQVWIPAVAENFPAGSTPTGQQTSGTLITPNGTWTVTTTGSSSSAQLLEPAIQLRANPAAPPTATTVAITSPARTVTSTGAWRLSVSLSSIAGVNLSGGVGNGFDIFATESTGDQYGVGIGVTSTGALEAHFSASGMPALVLGIIPQTVAVDFVLESDGEWVSGYANGQPIGQARRNSAATTSLSAQVKATGGAGNTGAQVTGVLLEALQPFLMRGTDKGDYVLPGGAATYPSGGLHARYSNNADLQSDPDALAKIHAPSRMQSYGAGAAAEYQNQQDAQINLQLNPQPGANVGWWSCIWFGAIYLKLSAGGSYTFTINTNPGGQFAIRIWVGKTKFGDQQLDQWATWHNQTTFSFSVSAASLAGSLPYGGGSVQRDGWYPIKVEYAVGAFAGGVTSYAAPQLQFTPPASYTDPGGAALTSGASVTVPATSLSPLGCVDQRYQAVSHFDLAQQTVQAFGYQAAVEPKQLESGLFPGVLAPRIREGHDTDVILEPDKGVRNDGQLLLNPRLANTWPLPGTIAAMRWRPGDGILVRDPDINIWDTTPRQILAFTRNLLPQGAPSAQASLAERPRTIARTLKHALYTVSRMQRNYQKQVVTLTGNYVTGQSFTAGGVSAASVIALLPSDQIVRAYVRCAWQTAAFGLAVNGTDQTSTLSGSASGWTTQPVQIDIRAVAATRPGFANGIGISAQTINKSGATNTVPDHQLFIDVLR